MCVVDPCVSVFVGGGGGGVGGCFFFFQAEDGIRDHCVTGVQTCALPIPLFIMLISRCGSVPLFILPISRCGSAPLFILPISRCGSAPLFIQIGRASCRERV